MPRLFTALEIPNATAIHLSLLQAGLPGARWVERESFHITLRFIGDVERLVAQELARMLEGVKTVPFSVSLENLDVFGHAKPHSLFAGVKKNESLTSLRIEQNRICEQLGLEPDSRKFTPHVTLARVRGLKPAAIAAYLSSYGGYRSDPIEIGRFVLLSSRDSMGGGPYVIQQAYELVEKDNAVT